MTISFHTLDALGELSDGLKRSCMAELEEAREKTCLLLNVNNLDIVVAPSPWVIPEYGMGGQTHGPGRITISLDPSSKRLLEPERRQRIISVLAHEIHHESRMRSNVISNTLVDQLVLEGLAQCFEEEVSGLTPFYAIALNRNQLSDFSERALENPCAITHDYNAWFFGKVNNAKWPRHAGYSLGYALIKSWLDENKMTAAEAVSIPTSEILQDWKSGKVSVCPETTN